MKIAVFSDEINREDPERAVSLASSWGVTHLEVRTLPGGRFPRPGDAELDRFHGLVADAGLVVSGVSPGFHKCAVSDPAVQEGMERGLPRACAWAQKWGADLVTCFGFLRDHSARVPDEVVDRLGQMADIARTEGCRVALENEAVCWGATGAEAAEIVRKVGRGRIGLCWDPGNSAKAGSTCPFPGEYEGLRDLVTHVHVKNYLPSTGAWEVADCGLVDWAGQFEALRDNAYAGYVVVETHLRSRSDRLTEAQAGLSGLEANTHHNLARVREWIGKTS